MCAQLRRRRHHAERALTATNGMVRALPPKRVSPQMKQMEMRKT